MFVRSPGHGRDRFLSAFMLRAFVFFSVLALDFELLAWNATHVPLGAAWRVFATGEEAPAGWKLQEFDDSSWTNGIGKIGIGHGDNTSVLPAPTISPRMTAYFRRTFFVPPGAPAATGLVARMVADAGAIIYLNGAEAGRVGMPAGAVAATTPANAEPQFPAENSLLNVPLDHSLLAPGENCVAVELHASSAFDFDLSFDLELISTSNPTPAFIVRGPYLQNASPNSITVRWRTNVPTATEVRAGTSMESLAMYAGVIQSTTEHEVRLRGLTPDTEYFYAIGNIVGAIEGPANEFRFRTPPLHGTVKPVRVWVLGDCGRGRSGVGSAEAVRNGYLNSPFYRKPDVWLMLGDNAYNSGTDNEYQNAVFDTYRSTLRQAILWSTLGNHETYSPDVPYFSIFTLPTRGEGGGVASGTENYYSFDYANIHFVCLDSMSSPRTAPSAMLAWLEADLAATAQRWIIAFWHHPPYTKGTHDSDSEIEHIEMRENVLPILEEYGVDLVLGGHSHNYERSHLLDGHYGYSNQLDPASIIDGGSGRDDEPDGAYGKDPGAHQGAVYCVAGSAGQPGGGTLDHPVMFYSSGELGSLILDVEGDRLDAKFLNHQGIIRDYFTISKAPLVTVSAPRATLAEGAGPPGIVRVSRTQEIDQPMAVQLTISGSATAGVDFSAPSVPATIPAGQASIDLPFSALTDSLAEGSETISVSLDAGAGYRLPKQFRSVALSLADRPVDAWRFEKFGPFANEPLIAGDLADADSDGETNLHEYIAGTEPRDAASRFIATPTVNLHGQFVVRFFACKGRSYTVFYRTGLTGEPWHVLTTVVTGVANQIVEVVDPTASASSQRFYTVVTNGPP